MNGRIVAAVILCAHVCEQAQLRVWDGGTFRIGWGSQSVSPHGKSHVCVRSGAKSSVFGTRAKRRSEGADNPLPKYSLMWASPPPPRFSMWVEAAVDGQRDCGRLLSYCRYLRRSVELAKAAQTYTTPLILALN